MLTDPTHQAEAEALAGPFFADIRSSLGGDKSPDDAPKPKDDEKDPKPSEPEPDLDEELDESFPASDPPASTQP